MATVTPSIKQAERASSRGLKWEERFLPYALLAPSVILLVLFLFYPILNNIVLSFFKADARGLLNDFVGINNYKDLANQKVFWEVLGRSFKWTFLAVIAKTVYGMILAVVLNQNFPGRNLARALVIFPWAASIVVMAVIWRFIYSDQPNVLGYALKSLGLLNIPPAWLARPQTGFWVTLWSDVWAGIPFMCLVFLSGMQSIPDELYDAAKIDGAGPVASFRHITLSFLRPVMVIATMLSALWTFNDFVFIYVITAGGPINTTDILITYIYKTAFKFLDFGHASAMATITFLILMVFAAVYVRLFFKEGLERW